MKNTGEGTPRDPPGFQRGTIGKLNDGTLEVATLETAFFVCEREILYVR